MISLKPLMAHLKPKPAGFAHKWFRDVEGAAEYARLTANGLPLPGCWIVRAADKSRHAGERAEDLTLAFDVVIAIENVRCHSAGDTDDILLAYRQAVKARLLGWQIEPDVRPLSFDGGRVLEYTDGDLFWADRYSFNALITNYLPDPPAFGALVNTGESL